MIVRDSIVGGLMLALSADVAFGGGLFKIVNSILSLDTSSNDDTIQESLSPQMMMVWIVVTTIIVVHLQYRSGILRGCCIRTNTHNNYIPLSNPGLAGEINSASYKQRTFSYPDSLIYNYIDPDEIPELLKPYAESIFTLAQSIMQVHGFQVDNSRNQSEHLIMLLFNETSSSDKMVSSPALRIHKRLFSNYRKWCERMGVRALLLTDINPVKQHESIIEDILMYLLIWGEAANLRHMPESLCFLFHKIMDEHLAHKAIWGISSQRQNENKYPGFFLDMVITPLYEVVARSLTKNVDHCERKIYDDFNEFFWSPTCLKYRLYDIVGDDTVENGHYDPHIEGTNTSALAVALGASSKTYLEKRSWFHALYSMNRLFEWHSITFTLLAVWAFSNLLQWTYVYTFQVGSIIFLQITFFGILWACLDVWTLFPSVRISDPSLCGYLIRILAGYLIFSYQTIYFHWAFVTQANTNLKELPLFNQGNNIFWWWQYLWLSIFACSLYFLQSFLALVPSVATSIMEYKSEVVQALLSICYPISQLYVGKNTAVPQKDVNQYILYWLSLLAFKLWFGYRYVVGPVATPTVELFDDYMNYTQVSFTKTFLLIFFWWFPHFLVYLIDLSIWYSVWSSLTGGFIALTDRLGAVRDSTSFRAHFMRAPKLFYTHFMPSRLNEDAVQEVPSHLSTMSLSEIVVEPRVAAPQVSLADKLKAAQAAAAGISQGSSSLPSKAKSSTDLPDSGYQSFSEIELRPLGVPNAAKRDFHQIKNQEWTVFARIWNEVVIKMRERDIISNRERELLLFSNFPWLSKPIYLPLYQTAGCVESTAILFKEACAEYESEPDKQLKVKVMERYSTAVGRYAFEAVHEAFEIFSWAVDGLMGNLHHEDCEMIFTTIFEWASDCSLFGRVSGNYMSNFLNHAGNIATALKSVANKRRNSPVVPPDMINGPSYTEGADQVETSSGSMKKSISTGFLSALGGEDNGKKFAKLQPFRKGTELVDNVRDKIREELKALFNIFKTATKGNPTAAASTVANKMTFIVNLKSGFFLNDIYASRCIDIFCKDSRVTSAISKLEDLLKLRITSVELKSHEANRRLNFLLNTLYMEVPKIPSTRYCKEFTCITPYYSEDILLNKADLLATNSDNVSVLLYLQTLYRDDWANFLERRGGIDEAQIWSPKHLQHLRIWASCRAQTLYRTVDGMMYNEAALRLLAELEQLAAPEVDLLSKLKFNYVVACQVYGIFKKNQESKADDIDFLLAKHQNLRVAYIDAHRLSPTEVAYYSVLVKCEPRVTGNEDFKDVDDVKDIKQRIKEVFRVKLPGNPVLGEGKPENQNHAVIFTRGRYLQAIDMNQDGYFEDALKMRNILEEFKAGYAIVGIREHIFTGAVSSVANYMALQELSFVTLGQRVLHRPLKIRQHYGHPDVFDKFFVMTEGGMSKASRGINLSEDVFAGFNATIRGYTIGFVEYAQVGKGRDVGLQQTYKFEAKLSQGNAEQSLSRDVSRIANRLDFYRLFSFYYGGIGHYLSNALVMFTLVIVVYTMFALALYHEEGVNGRPMKPEGLFQLILAGMGILQTLPLAVTLTVEKGFAQAISEISFMIISGGPLYFIFHIQTKSYYFSQTLLAGGAMYRPTGRGFVTRHSPFEENYRFFASSHIYLGFELMVALTFLGFYTTSKQYPGLTWSLWLAAISFVMGPFWFNPLSFEWSRIQDDYNSWLRWMLEIGGSSEQSWESWWKEENSFYQKLSTTWKFFLIVQKCFLWIFIAAGVAGRQFFTHTSEQLKFLVVLEYVAIFFVGQAILNRFERQWNYGTRRFCSLALTSYVAIYIVYLFIAHPRHFLYLIALYYFASAIAFLFLVNGQIALVMRFYKLHDYVVSHFIFLLLSLASILQVSFT